jgi:hypothetical protein
MIKKPHKYTHKIKNIIIHTKKHKKIDNLTFLSNKDKREKKK